MKLTIIGCYAATPTAIKNPTAQILEINNELVLIDCGEGTQAAIRRHKIKLSRLNYIFISHLHGDHYYGLIGLISTLSLLKREKPLYIYGPQGIKEIIVLQQKLSKAWTNYPLHFIELSSKSSVRILETDKLTVDTIPLNHRIYTNGFLFRETRKDRKLLINKALEYNIDKAYFTSIKKGKDAILDDGRIIPNSELTEEPPKPLSYAFCSDTKYDEQIVPVIKHCTVLYHESTFLDQHANLAATTKHSTAKEAAQIAEAAKAKNLILGHYSTRYKGIQLFKEEAQSIFENTLLAEDRKTFNFSG